MPLPLLAIFGASLVIGTLVVVALLKWKECTSPLGWTTFIKRLV